MKRYKQPDEYEPRLDKWTPCDVGDMDRDDGGPWVLYEDAARLAEAADRLAEYVERAHPRSRDQITGVEACRACLSSLCTAAELAAAYRAVRGEDGGKG